MKRAAMNAKSPASEEADGPELSAEQLRWRCDPAVFPFETTAQMEDRPPAIIGQPRAVEALRLGLDLQSAGYNVFVAGEVGTGRSTAVRQQLEALDPGETPPPDLCYVHNFRDPDQPRLLSFPAGQGTAFREAMHEMVEALRKSLPELFESQTYRQRSTDLVEAAKARHKEYVRGFEKQIEAEGFVLVQLQTGPHVQLQLMRLVEGKPADLDDLEALVERGQLDRAEFERLREAHGRLSGMLESVARELNRLQRELRVQLLQLDRDLARPRIEEAVGELRRLFGGEPVAGFLDEAAADILDHLDRFREAQEQPAAGVKLDRARDRVRQRMLPYAVNVLVDNSRTEGKPILWETSPTYRNLFGTIDRFEDSSGEWRTDHTRIKSGSVLRASGGILVLDAMDVLAEAGVWATLKRTLRNRVVEIRAFDPLNLFASVSLKPERVPIDVKVLMIGTHQIHRLLYALDEDFKKIFKVKADFTVQTPKRAEEIQSYACLVQRMAREEHLHAFHRGAMASVVEHGVRLAGHREKLTTRFHEIADLVREADYWARQEQAKLIEARHVERALEQRTRRLDLVEELFRERIAEGTVLLDTAGAKVGQINALTVLDTGDYEFGLPARITATTALGRAGIVNVEREARLSAASHTKGVLILAGFLRSTFAQDKPLALSASLCFEQSYGPVAGDSASAAELFALLSSLGGVPLRQSIAVTGSVNQKGEIQPIGGVNQKIEGYFDLCRLQGLTGEQGVMIPAKNVQNLQLRKDLIEAVREARFHVYAVSTVEEGIEILTGIPAGTRDEAGRFPENSVFGRADKQLRRLTAAVREHGAADLRLEA
jgi:ATP-dependent Lon protease